MHSRVFLPIRNTDMCTMCKYLEKLYYCLIRSRNIRQRMDKPTMAYPSSVTPFRTKRTHLLWGSGKRRSVEEKDIWLAAWGWGWSAHCKGTGENLLFFKERERMRCSPSCLQELLHPSSWTFVKTQSCLIKREFYYVNQSFLNLTEKRRPLSIGLYW